MTLSDIRTSHATNLSLVIILGIHIFLPDWSPTLVPTEHSFVSYITQIIKTIKYELTQTPGSPTLATPFPPMLPRGQKRHLCGSHGSHLFLLLEAPHSFSSLKSSACVTPLEAPSGHEQNQGVIKSTFPLPCKNLWLCLLLLVLLKQPFQKTHISLRGWKPRSWAQGHSH